MWDKLKSRFAQPDNVRIYHLQQQLGCIVQGTQLVSDYFTQLNAIWEELRNYRPLPFCSCGHCTCDTLSSVGETQQLDYVFKFLMGLNDSYDSIRGHIILMSPMPSLEKTFSLVLQEERQRQARTMVLPAPKSSALAALHVQTKKKDKSEITCYHCGKVGHTKEKCYRLIGFPPNFKFTRSKLGNAGGTQVAMHLANQVLSQSREDMQMNGSHLPCTQAQIQQLIALINAQTPQLSLNDLSGSQSPNLAKPLLPTPTKLTDDTTSSTPSSNMAGIGSCLSSFSVIPNSYTLSTIHHQ